MREMSRLILYLAFTLELLVLFMVQETPGILPHIYGARPVLVLPAGLIIAMLQDEVPAMAFGILAGLFCDFGFSGLLGFHAIIMGVMCFFISIMVKAFLQANIVTSGLTGIVCLALIFLAQWLFFYYFHYTDPGFALKSHYVPKYLYTLLFVPLIYIMNKGLRDSLRPQES